MVETIISWLAISYITTIVIFIAINYMQLRHHRQSFTVGDVMGLNSDDICWLYIPVLNTCILVLYGLMYLYLGVMTLIEKFVNIKLK
jgi:hypothetical protein